MKNEIGTDSLQYLDYIWISKFRGIENKGFCFSHKYYYDYDDETKMLKRMKNQYSEKYIDNFFDDNIEVNAIIGKNGCGKTSLMQAIYAFFEKTDLKPNERILIVFRNGTVYTTIHNTSQKFKSGQSELAVEWNSDIIKYKLNMFCLYYTNVLDYQFIDYYNQYERSITNLSLTYQINNYLNGRYSNNYIFNSFIFADNILKGFFLDEFKKQIVLLKEIPDQDRINLNLPIPQYIRITLKDKDTLIDDLEHRFNYQGIDIKHLFEKVKNNEALITANPHELFLNNLSLCILATLIYSICLYFDFDHLDYQEFIDLILFKKKNRYHSYFSFSERTFIILELLNIIIKKIKKQKGNATKYYTWNIICDLLNTIIMLDCPLETFINDFLNEHSLDLHKIIYNSFYSKDKKQSQDYETYSSLQLFENDLGEELNLEIKNDLKILADSAISLSRIAYYLSTIKDSPEIVFKSKTELWIDLSNNRTKSIYFLKQLWNRYQSMGLLYEYMFFSWNLSSGEYARWSMFAKIYYQLIEIKNRLKYSTENLIILFDEADMLLHPEWQQNFVEHIIAFMKMMFPNIQTQIIIATHSPIMLSDIPKQNTILIEKNPETGKIDTIDGSETFAANIFSLYQDSFFIKNTGIGSFAKSKLIDMVNDIHKKDGDNYKYSNEELLKLIDLVGDVYLRAKLKNEFFLYRSSTDKEKEENMVAQMRTELREKETELLNVKEELEKLKKKMEAAPDDKN